MNKRQRASIDDPRMRQTLQCLGFTWSESFDLSRISRTLRRWAERECGDSNGHASWAIERDETSDKPYMVVHSYNPNHTIRYPIPDREKGALRRLSAILNARNIRESSPITFYHQADPRGCALYLIRPGDVPAGKDVSSYYTNGVAVY